MSSCGNGAPIALAGPNKKRAAAELLPCRRIRYTPRIAALSLLLLVWVRVRVRRHVETPAVHLSLENSVRGYERQRLVRTQGLVPARVALVIIPKGTRYRVHRAKTVTMAHATATFAPSPTGSGSSISGGRPASSGDTDVTKALGSVMGLKMSSS